MKHRIHHLSCFRNALAATLLLGLVSCITVPTEFTPVGDPVAWEDLPGWDQDRHAEIWPALVQNCQTRQLPEDWQPVCDDVLLLTEPDDDLARYFLETRFQAYELENRDGSDTGLITGYFEPLLMGNLKQTEQYRYPVYQTPPDLLKIDLSSLYPELNGRPVRGRLEGRRVVPYYSREQIDNGKKLLSGHEIAWVEDPVELFFLHVQGSGRIVLPDGSSIAVGYADQNGHPYESIGATLIRMGELKREDVNLVSIVRWLQDNPDRVNELLNSNPSYIFFDVRKNGLAGPIGSLGVPLTPQRSAAVDRRYIPLGSLLWIDTTLPDEKQSRFQRVLAAQDTGGAIKGVIRADIFFGQGPQARTYAGQMKQEGRLFLLKPRVRQRYARTDTPAPETR